MKELTPEAQAGVQAHISGIMALIGGTNGGMVTIITATTPEEHRDELRRVLWERHDEDVYDPKLFGVHRLPTAAASSTDVSWQAHERSRAGASARSTDLGGGAQATDPRAAVPAEALLPSFEEVPDDTVMRVSVPMLTRALRTWDEESKDKGWSERDDEERHAQNARYILGIVLEHQSWEIKDALRRAVDDGVVGGISRSVRDIVGLEIRADGARRVEYATAELLSQDSEVERLIDRLQKTGGTIEITVYSPPEPTTPPMPDRDEG